MPVNRIRKCTDILEATAFLNGAVFGGAFSVVSGIVGKTFKLLTPAVATVTFVAAASPPGGDPTALLIKDIKAQIEAAVATLRVTQLNGKICFTEVTPTAGVSVDRTGTANAILGLDAAIDTTGKVYAPPPSATAPCWTTISASQDNSYVITTWE